MNFIEDKELQNLYEEDLLETRKYAVTLKNIVEESKGPLTIGIFGEWGSGKSSIINTVKNNPKDKKIKFVIYDAWKYNGDSFRRIFLKELANQLNVPMEDKFENFYIDKNESLEKSKGINWKLIAIVILAIVVLIDLSMFKNVEIAVILTFIATIVGIVGKDVFHKNTITINHLRLFAPEQFEEIYQEIIDSIFKNNFNPIKWVKEKIEGKIEKIVIVIDNLDRCNDDNIYELLTTIKTFLQKENVIFIIPIDDLRLKKFLAENHKLNEKEVDEFLRKIFDVTLKIKQFKPLDMFHYTNKLNNNYKLNLQPDTIDIFAKEYATNPRRIIQLINNLLVEKDILKNKFNEDFINNYESLIAKLLIIREEWPDFYNRLQNNPKLLNNWEQEQTNNKDKINDELINFLKRTKGYSVNIELSITEKMISNIDRDYNMNNDVLEKLNNHNYDDIDINNIDNNLLIFVFEDLVKEIQNQTFKGGALNRFKNLIKLNSKKELPLNFIKKFGSDFNSEDILKIIENLDSEDFDDLFKFINLLHTKGFDVLLNSIIKKYREIWKKDFNKEDIEKLPKVWNDGLDYLINNIEDENIIKSLQKSFIYFYDYYSESPLYKDQWWIEKNKLKYILSQEFINYLIDKVDEKFENDAFKELVFFAEKNLLNIKQIEKLFEKLDWYEDNNFQDQNEAQEKCILDLIDKIENLNKLLQLLKPIEYESEIIENKLNYLQKVTKKVKRQGVGNYYDDKNIILLDDLNEYQAKKLLEFYLNIYKSTYNNTNVLDYIQKLVNKYQDLKTFLYSNLIILQSKYNFTLKPFVDYLLSQKQLNNDLLKIYLSYIKSKEILKKYNEQIKNKLIELLKQYNNEIKWFFDKILDKEILKNALIELLKEDFESFEKLSITLKNLSFDYICENELIKKFENDIEILKELAKENYSQCIKNVLIKKLGEEKIDEVLDILNSFEKIDKLLWKNLKLLLEEYKEKYEDKISEIENKVENVLSNNK